MITNIKRFLALQTTAARIHCGLFNAKNFLFKIKPPKDGTCPCTIGISLLAIHDYLLILQQFNILYHNLKFYTQLICY